MATSDTILCIHHYFTGGWVWHPMASFLSRQGYTLRVPDLPGHHRAQGLKPEADLEQLSLGLWRRLELAPQQRVHLLGHGFGGLVAQILAQQFPDRVQSLTLAHSISHTNHTGIFGRKLKGSKPPPSIGKLSKAMQQQCNYPQWAKRIGQSVAHFNNDLETYKHYWQLQQNFDSRPWLDQLQMPCLLINTGKQGSTLAEQFKNAEQQWLQGAGFWFMLEAPEAASLCLATFLNNLWQRDLHPPQS